MGKKGEEGKVKEETGEGEGKEVEEEEEGKEEGDVGGRGLRFAL